MANGIILLMSGNNKGVAFLPVMIFLLLALAVGYALFKSYSGTNNNKITDEPDSKEEIVTPTADLLSDWKVYKSQKYNYRFKYPQESKLSNQTEEYVAVSYMGEKQKASGRTQTELFDGYAFNVANVTEFGYGDLDDFFIQKVNQLKEVCSEIGNPRETTISGRRAITHKLSCLGDYDTYYVMNDDQYFEISLLHVGDEEDLPKYTETVNRIFSTFEFVE